MNSYAQKKKAIKQVDPLTVLISVRTQGAVKILKRLLIIYPLEIRGQCKMKFFLNNVGKKKDFIKKKKILR